MRIARVIGTVVATIHHEDHGGCKLLLVQPVDDRAKPYGTALIAIDSAQAGVGDYVLVLEEGKGSRQVLDRKTAPVEALIVGVIDHLMTGGRTRKLKPAEE